MESEIEENNKPPVIPMDSNKSIETCSPELARATDSNIESNKSKDEDCDSSSNVEMKSQSDNESNSTLTHNIEEKIQLNSTPHVISDLDSSSLNSSICQSKGYASNSSTDDRKDKDFIPPLSVGLKTPGGTDKTATNGENDENTPGPSNVNRNGTNTPNKRPKCKYGKQCYRKNPQHKIEFCHKGDTEYETSSSEESETDKPQCMYGSACFRKNSEHRKKFSHKQSPSVTRKRKKPTKGSKSPNGSPSRTKKRRKTATSGAAGGTADVNMSSEEDSYDYEDPFLANDATEDEYVATSSLSESSSPLSDPEDDSHTNKRLIKEAKRFMR
uniref:Aprataxin and PNK-like factor n=1 Tax=Cacopsylla melanoneura TaxID=428564 RepID=A0A8D8XHE7_9HEMI